MEGRVVEKERKGGRESKTKEKRKRERGREKERGRVGVLALWGSIWKAEARESLSEDSQPTHSKTKKPRDCFRMRKATE